MKREFISARIIGDKRNVKKYKDKFRELLKSGGIIINSSPINKPEVMQ
jgi:hypothetical protein